MDDLVGMKGEGFAFYHFILAMKRRTGGGGWHCDHCRSVWRRLQLLSLI